MFLNQCNVIGWLGHELSPSSHGANTSDTIYEYIMTVIAPEMNRLKHSMKRTHSTRFSIFDHRNQ